LKAYPPEGWSTTDNWYEFFPANFYAYALGLMDSEHHTIRESLNYAAEETFGTYGDNVPYTFYNCILSNPHWDYIPDTGMSGWWYGNYMRVFGNSNLMLPS
jgi:hypothetical protein